MRVSGTQLEHGKPRKVAEGSRCICADVEPCEAAACQIERRADSSMLNLLLGKWDIVCCTRLQPCLRARSLTFDTQLATMKTSSEFHVLIRLSCVANHVTGNTDQRTTAEGSALLLLACAAVHQTWQHVWKVKRGNVPEIWLRHATLELSAGHITQTALSVPVHRTWASTISKRCTHQCR